MNRIKIFKATIKEMSKMEEMINSWAEENNYLIIQITLIDGETYSTFGSRIENKEIIMVVLYSSINNAIVN